MPTEDEMNSLSKQQYDPTEEKRVEGWLRKLELLELLEDEYVKSNTAQGQELIHRADVWKSQADDCPARCGCRCNLNGEMCIMDHCFGLYWRTK
jgi:hypothetical protein